MCKKLTKNHHTLLHRDADYLAQKKPENKERTCKEETHVVPPSVSKQVLLITCIVKITAPDGSSTIERVLINLGSSALFVHEQLPQHLCLLSSNKNESV